MRQKPTIHFDFWMQRAPALRSFYESLAPLTEKEIIHIAAQKEPTAVGVNMVTAMALYRKYGQQVFSVGPCLCDSFLHAQLDNIPADLVHLPYPAFYITMPPGALQIWGGEETQWHDATGIYVFNLDSHFEFSGGRSEHLDQIRFLVWGKYNERSRNTIDDALYWFGIDWKKERTNLENIVRDRIAETVWMDIMAPHDAADIERMQQTVVGVLRIVLNLCLYLLSENRDVIVDTSFRDQRQRLLRKASHLKGRTRQRMLNKASTKTDPIITYLAPTIEADARDTSDGHQRPRRHWVRLHKRTYWVGPGRECPTIRGINPYERGGREDEETRPRQYQVKEG